MRRIAIHTGTSSRRHATPSRLGAATVEFALVLPIFIMVTLGIIEFGRAFMVGQLVTNAAREGARQAVIDGATNSSVTSYVTTFLQGAANVAPADVTVTITVDSATAGNQLSNASSKDLCTVRVSVPYTKVSFLPPTYLTSQNLVGQSSMRHE